MHRLSSSSLRVAEMEHLETKWVHCCQAGAFHLILLSLQSDCHPLVNTWCCHQRWYHYSYAWEGDAFTLAAGSPSVRHFHFIINQTTNGVAFSSFLVSVRWGTSLSLYSQVKKVWFKLLSPPESAHPCSKSSEKLKPKKKCFITKKLNTNMLFIKLSNRDTIVVDLSLLWRCDILNVFQWKSKQLVLQQDLRDGNRRSVYKKHWTLVPAAPQTGTCFLTSSANWGSASDNMACRFTNCSRRGKVRKRKWQRVGEKKQKASQGKFRKMKDVF